MGEGFPDDTSADQLDADVGFDETLSTAQNSTPVSRTPAERISEADAKLKEAHAVQADQNTLWRRILFWGVSGIVAAVVILNAVVVIIYLAAPGQPPDPVVLSTWFAASVAQVIGLLLVITRHLFPGEGNGK